MRELQGGGISLIKMDIEGSELKALEGAKNSIKNYMPALAICVYHRTEDLITIPQFIKTFETNQRIYKLFLRKYHIMSNYELVLYAIPNERKIN